MKFLKRLDNNSWKIDSIQNIGMTASRQFVSKTIVLISHEYKEYANVLLEYPQHPVGSFHFRPRIYRLLVEFSLRSIQVKHFVFPPASILMDYTQTSGEDVFELN